VGIIASSAIAACFGGIDAEDFVTALAEARRNVPSVARHSTTNNRPQPGALKQILAEYATVVARAARVPVTQHVSLKILSGDGLSQLNRAGGGAAADRKGQVGMVSALSRADCSRMAACQDRGQARWHCCRRNPAALDRWESAIDMATTEDRRRDALCQQVIQLRQAVGSCAPRKAPR